jgi:hypothetical protein
MGGRVYGEKEGERGAGKKERERESGGEKEKEMRHKHVISASHVITCVETYQKEAAHRHISAHIQFPAKKFNLSDQNCENNDLVQQIWRSTIKFGRFGWGDPS